MILLQIQRLESELSKNRESSSTADLVMTSQAGQSYSVPSLEEIRRMEADLKRKTDLLGEVKILLKQVCDWDRHNLCCQRVARLEGQSSTGCRLGESG